MPSALSSSISCMLKEIYTLKGFPESYGKRSSGTYSVQLISIIPCLCEFA